MTPVYLMIFGQSLFEKSYENHYKRPCYLFIRWLLLDLFLLFAIRFPLFFLARQKAATLSSNAAQAASCAYGVKAVLGGFFEFWASGRGRTQQRARTRVGNGSRRLYSRVGGCIVVAGIALVGKGLTLLMPRGLPMRLLILSRLGDTDALTWSRMGISIRLPCSLG